LGWQAEHSRLFLLVRANLAQRFRVRPDSLALGARELCCRR
jgi:hypothetical protein